MTLLERCTECDWSETWEGGTADEDPAVEHAKETGHEVKSTPLDEPPERPDPPMHEEWEGVETWTQGSLRYPVPGGWDLDDHGKFHTKWVHEDGATLSRSTVREPGPKDTFKFTLDGEEFHRAKTGPKRVEMREETVWALTFYDERDDVDSPETFEEAKREAQNQSLTDYE